MAVEIRVAIDADEAIKAQQALREESQKLREDMALQQEVARQLTNEKKAQAEEQRKLTFQAIEAARAATDEQKRLAKELSDVIKTGTEEEKAAAKQALEMAKQIAAEKRAIAEQQKRTTREAYEAARQAAEQEKALARDVSEIEKAAAAQRRAAAEEEKRLATEQQQREEQLAQAARDAAREEANAIQERDRQSQDFADRQAKSMAKMLIILDAVKAGFQLAFNAVKDFFVGAVNDSIKFEAKLAEISTLFQGGFDTAKARKDLLDLSSAFGLDQADVAKGYYDTISAGITDAADAAKVLEGAAKLATGGLTSQATAITGLTNIIKGYSLDVSKTAEITDTLFIGAQVGKTTIDELSNSIGQVSPLANAAGVSFRETVAAMSALTLSGKTTAEATTGLRGAIENLIRPNADMTKALEKAGITSVTAALQTDGLTGVFQKLSKVSGGTTEGLAKIFGSVEGLQAVLSLAGPQAGDYAQALKQMGEAAQNAGTVTDGAVKKIQATADFQLKALSASFRNVGTEIFTSLEPGIAKGAELLVGFIDGIRKFVRENEASFKAVGEAFSNFIDKIYGFAEAVQQSNLFQAALIELQVVGTELFDYISSAVVEVANAFSDAFGSSTTDVMTFRDVLHTFLSFLAFFVKETVFIIKAVAVGIANIIEVFNSAVTMAKYAFTEIKNAVVDNLTKALNFVAEFVNKISIAFKTLDAVTGKKTFSGITDSLDSFKTSVKDYTDSIDRVKIASKDLANSQKKNAVDNIALIQQTKGARVRAFQEEMDAEKESASDKEYYAKQAKERRAKELEDIAKKQAVEKKAEEERKKARENEAKDHEKYLKEQQAAEYEAFKAQQDAEAFNNEQILKLEQELTDDLNKAALERATRQVEILKEQAKAEEDVNKERGEAFKRAQEAMANQAVTDVQQKFTLFGGTQFDNPDLSAIDNWKAKVKDALETYRRGFDEGDKVAKAANESAKQYLSGLLGFAEQVASSIISVGAEWSKIQEAEFAAGNKAAQESAAKEVEAYNEGLEKKKEALKESIDEEIKLFEEKNDMVLATELERIETVKATEIEAVSEVAQAKIDALKEEADAAKSARQKALEDQLYPIEVKKDEELIRLKEVQREELKNSEDITVQQIADIKVRQRAELRAIEEKYAPEIEALKNRTSEDEKAANKALEAKKKLILDEEKEAKEAITRKYKHEEDEAKKANDKIVEAYKKTLDKRLDDELSVLEKLKKVSDKNAKDEGKNADIATQKLNAVSKTADAIGSVFEKLPGPVGQIGSLIAGLVSLVNRLPQIIRSLPEMIKGITNSIPVLIDELGKALGEFIPWLIKDIAQRSFDVKYWLEILKNLGGAVGNIFKGVFDAIGDLVDFKSWGGKIWDGLKNAGSAAGDWLASLGGKIWDGLKALGDTIGQFFSDLGGKIWSGVTSLAETIWAWFKDIGAKIWNGLKEAVGDIFVTFGKWGRAIWDGFTTAVKDIALWFKEKGIAIWDGVKEAIGSIAETFGKWGRAIWDGLWSGIQTLWNWLYEAGKRIWDGLKSVFSFGFFSKGGGVGPAYGTTAYQTSQATATQQMGGNWGGRALGGLIQAADGFFVPGNPRVSGDSTRNDTVPALLSPGELVIPRSAVGQGLPGVMAFARDYIRGSAGFSRMATGGYSGLSASGGQAILDDGLVLEMQALRADINSIGDALAKNNVKPQSEEVVVQIDGREIARAVRNQTQRGFQL